MDKKLQDLAWSILPKEFKEEVKNMYKSHSALYRVISSSLEKIELKNSIKTLEYLFGKHNLTSDAEGEEMLYVPRKKVIQRYADTIKGLDGNISNSEEYFLNGKLTILKNLFGTKCLPNEEPKPAEPKFKVGDIASYVCSPTLKHKCTITEAVKNEHSGKWEYNVMFEWGRSGKWIPESDLEPYTEPAEPTCTRTCTDDCPSQSRNLSQETANCDKCNDRRLHIAAMAMQGILGNADRMKSYEQIAMSEPYEDLSAVVARNAVRYANALIAESEKGGAVGNS